MRIEPKREVVTALQATTSAEEADGFADALASAQNPFSETPSIAEDAANAGKAPPLAQRWGQYGLGATEAGFGAPNPALYADKPVGPDAPASPLNPGGVTTTPSFVVSGYTGRGTPVPPGFYNIAYYNMYLDQGGTPLVGFPKMEDGSTLSATYGTFGDGAERATSYLTGLVDDPSDGSPAGTSAAADPTAGADASTTLASALAALVNAAAATNGGSSAPGGTETGASTASASDSAAPATTAAPAPAAVTQVAATTATSATSTDAPASTASATAAASPASGADLLRTELAALLGDLLRSA